jgi:hypothetical protein
MGANPFLDSRKGCALKIRKSRLLGPWNGNCPPPHQSCSKTHVHKATNVPVFIWFLDLMILMGANPLLGPLEGVGPWNRFAHIKIITSRAKWKTSTLIVIFLSSHWVHPPLPVYFRCYVLFIYMLRTEKKEAERKKVTAWRWKGGGGRADLMRRQANFFLAF